MTTELSPQQVQILQRLDALETALTQQDPAIKTHMAEIHKLLIQYEELVHFLTIEQIGVIMAQQQKLTNTSLVQAVVSKKANKAKSAGLTLDEL